MELLGAKLEDMDFDFLQSLADHEIPENFQLEYKGHDFLFNGLRKSKPTIYEKHQIKLVKVMSALANTHGGFIVFGIKEKVVGKDHIPDCIEGAEIEDFNSTLTSLIHKAIQPSILFNYKKIENTQDPEKPIYVLEIAESPVPVMMYWRDKKHEGAFPIRRDDKSQIANIVEVNQLFQRTAHLRELQMKAQRIYSIIKEIIKSIKYKEQKVTQLRFEQLIELQHDCLKLDIIFSNSKGNSKQIERPKFEFLLINRRYVLDYTNLCALQDVPDDTVERGALLESEEDYFKNSKFEIEFLQDLKGCWANRFLIYVD